MKYSQYQIQQLDRELADNIEELLSELRVDYQKGWNRLWGKCPIHLSDNPNAWSLYPEGEVCPSWYCFTRKCHERFNQSMTGLVRGRRSYMAGELDGFQNTIKWILSFLGHKSLDEIKTPSKEELKKQRENNFLYSLYNGGSARENNKWNIKHVRSQLQIPSQYYLDRGYSKEILDKYSIGYLDKQKRVVVPILDNEGKYVVGFTKRSVYEKCKCGFHHNPSFSCPTSNLGMYSKWTNSSGLESKYHLFNLWNAAPHIRKTNTAILVEGVGDSLRLEEAGIHNSVGLFGTSLSEPQTALLDANFTTDVIVLLDSGEAGERGRKNIRDMLKRTHKLYFPELPKEDVGEMTIGEIQTLMREIK